MGSHDDYGKSLMRKLLANRWNSYDSRRSVDEAGVRADLDGIITTSDGRHIECAVEIEARVYKQIRGAMVDLALHPAPKKFLVVIKAQPQLGNTAKITRHCNYIWQQISGADRGQFAMVVLEGTGDNPMPDVDLALLRGALQSQGLLISDSASVGFAS